MQMSHTGIWEATVTYWNLRGESHMMESWNPGVGSKAIKGGS